MGAVLFCTIGHTGRAKMALKLAVLVALCMSAGVANAARLAPRRSPPVHEYPCPVTDELHPVCGTDGVTYDNPSHALCAGTEIAYDGPCPGSDIQLPIPPESKNKRSAKKTKAKLLGGLAARMSPPLPEYPGEIGCAVTEELYPVCGTDGVTYDNPSHAFCAGAEVVHDGPCTGSDSQVPVSFESKNKKSEEKKAKKTLPPADCIMTADWSPVCGSDGITYANPSHASCSGVSVVYGGPCNAPDARKTHIKKFKEKKSSDKGCKRGSDNCHAEAAISKRTSPCDCSPEDRPVCASSEGRILDYENPCLANCDGAHILYEGYCIVIDVPTAIGNRGDIVRNSAKKMTISRRRAVSVPNPPHIGRPTKNWNAKMKSMFKRYSAH